jgi:hypothetical protein
MADAADAGRSKVLKSQNFGLKTRFVSLAERVRPLLWAEGRRARVDVRFCTFVAGGLAFNRVNAI